MKNDQLSEWILRIKPLVRERLARGALLRDVSGLWVAEAVGLVSAVVQGVLVARWLGPRSYGIAALVMSYPTVIYFVMEVRSPQATVKYLGQFLSKGETKRALAVSRLGYFLDGGIGLLAFALVAVTATWAQNHVVRASGTAGLLVAYSAALMLQSPTGTSQAVLSTFGRFSTLAIVQMVGALARTTLVLGFVAAGLGVKGVVWGASLGMALEAAPLVAIAIVQTRVKWGRASLADLWSALSGWRREIARFIAWADVGSMLAVLVKQFDLVILGYLRGPTEVGYYRLARSIAGLGGVVVGPLQSVVYPRLARLWGAEDRVELARAVRRYALCVGLPLGAVGLLSIPFVSLAISTVVGAKFGPATPATQILVAGTIVWMAFFWLQPLLLTLGEVKFGVINSGLVALLSLAGFAAFTPRWGYVGMAWVQFTLAGLLGHALALAYLLRRHGIALSPTTDISHV